MYLQIVIEIELRVAKNLKCEEYVEVWKGGKVWSCFKSPTTPNLPRQLFWTSRRFEPLTTSIFHCFKSTAISNFHIFNNLIFFFVVWLWKGMKNWVQRSESFIPSEMSSEFTARGWTEEPGRVENRSARPRVLGNVRGARPRWLNLGGRSRVYFSSMTNDCT